MLYIRCYLSFIGCSQRREKNIDFLMILVGAEKVKVDWLMETEGGK